MDYLPTVPERPENAVCKTSPHVERHTIIEVLKLLYIIVHAEMNKCAPGVCV